MGTNTVMTGAGRDTEAADTKVMATTELMDWEKAVALVQAAFGEGCLEEEATWRTVVLIPKGEVNYPVIGLLELVWKVVAMILNIPFTASITFQDVLHCLWSCLGTGTSTLKSKLLQ